MFTCRRNNLNDAAFMARAHGRQYPICQFLRAEDVGFELRARRRARKIFHRARLSVRGVVIAAAYEVPTPINRVVP